MKTLTPAIKTYLLRVYAQFEEGKLTPAEETSLFQDIYDSGLFLEMNPAVKILIQNLIKQNRIQKRDERVLN
jgi:hypothetical protein